jgi:rSAM/selenodomain-associated transferase 2/rSAM/selenodomain-associated transferase 1
MPNANRRTASDRVIVFTRYPEPGKTKTRLIARLGADGAADLHRQMTEHLFRQLRPFARDHGTAVEVRFDGGSQQQMRAWLGDDMFYRCQSEGNLGRRMGDALESAFGNGSDRAVIIGCDIPGIDGGVLQQAFAALSEHDLVFGPACDGGYYLVGMTRAAHARALPRLFEFIPWGTAAVLAKSLQIAEATGLRVAFTTRLADVDRPEDISVWETLARTSTGFSDTEGISVIIPALNEAGTIGATLAAVQRGSGLEVIVVDGGSCDATASIAASRRVNVITAPRGRARQMNAGAARASGDILLFLHADTRLPDGYDRVVRRALASEGVVAGAFALGIDSAQPSLRIMERVANLRSRCLQMPYGDQGLFLRADVFRAMGGFSPLPIMEDFDLVQRLRRKGRICILPLPVTTSARRWIAVGAWRAWLINQLVVGGYFLKIPPAKLARFYHRRHGLHEGSKRK